MSISPLRTSLGLNHAENVYDYAKDQFVTITPGNPKAIIDLPMTAKSVTPLIRADQGSQHDEQYVRAYGYKLQLLPVYYRVIEKNLLDGNGHTYTFSYGYTSPALNDSVTSPNSVCPDGATDCKEYVPKYSEFRGHKIVTETGPDGRVIVTEFYQDDNFKGQVKSVLVEQGDKVSETIKEYNAIDLPMQPLVYQHPCCSGTVYRGVKHVWTYQTSQENRIYTSNGSYSATREVYTYEPTYGNQTEVLQQIWRGGAIWENYLKTKTSYHPNASGVYLVSLPASVAQVDFFDEVVAETWFFYDGNVGSHTVAPTVGKLTSQRTRTGTNTWSQVSYAYDTWGNSTSEKTWSGYGTSNASPTQGARVTTTQYDPAYHTYPISVTNPLNQTTFWTYNYRKSVPVSETDPNGVVTRAEYDDFGRMVKLIRPGDDSANPTLLVSYSNSAPFETTIRQRLDGNRYFGIRRVYDGMGRQVLQQSGSGTASGALTVLNTVDTLYVSVYETHQSVPYGLGETPGVYDYTITLVDPGGRSTTVTAPDGSQTRTVIDGLTTTVTDPAGRVTTSRADVWGRTISVTPPEGPGVTYTYDLLGRLLTATRGEIQGGGGATTSLAYDMAGRKIGMSDPDMGDWTYTYDALGNLTSQTDARGCTLSLAYDLLNRLKSKTSLTLTSSGSCGEAVAIVGTAGENVIYTYDQGANGIGRRTAMQDGSTGLGSTTWAYDARGRMTLENKRIDGQTYTTRWTYNSADLPVAMTYPDGEDVTTAYDENMLLESVIGADTYVQSTTYDFAARMTGRSLGNGLTQVYNYYDWTQRGGRLERLKTTSLSTQVTLQDLLYQYDSVGNIAAISDFVNVETQIFEYDPLDRLTMWTSDGFVQGIYTYSPTSGNLIGKGSSTLAYTDPAHVHAATSMGGNTYVYDENGNQKLRNIDDDGSYSLLYDAENRLVEVKKNDTTIAEFVFDGDGRRVIGIENGKTVHYVGSHYEVDADNNNTQAPVSVAVPTSTFDTNTTWQTQTTSPGTWLWRSTWWGAHAGTVNYVLTNNAYGNLTSKPIPVTPNTQYVLSGWVRGQINDQQGEAGWIIRAAYYTSTDQYITYTDIASGTGSSTSTTWAQKSGTVTTPADAAFVRVFLYNHLSSGWVGFDDISFKKSGTGTELLEDPGFELGTGWTTTQTSPGTSLMREGWLGKRSGAYGYRITNNAYGDLSSDSIRVYPNTQYTLSGWVRGELDDTQGMAGWFLRVAFYNIGGQPISYLDAASGTGSTLLTTWAQKSGMVTSPANAVSARVFLCNHLTSGWVAFDDISFKQSNTTTELLSDTGFETGTGWTANQGMPATWLWRSTWGEASPRSGSYGYAITNMVYGDLSSKLIPVTSGSQYDISTWIRGEIQGGGGFIVRVEAYNNNGQYMFYTDLAGSWQGIILTPAWQQLLRQYTAPAGAAYIRVRLFNHRASGWAAFDDLSVKKTGTTAELLQNPGFEAVNSTPLNNTSTSDGYSVDAGTAYSITVNIRGEKTDPSGTWLMRANFYDNSGQLLESKDIASQATHALSLASQMVNVWVKSPAGAASVKIELQANFATGWVSFDDIVIAQAAGAATKYYFAGASRIAMRTCSGTTCQAPTFLLSDHLGSTSITTDATGAKTSELRYSPWGEVRPGTAWSASPGLPTDYTFTGQRSYMDDPTTTAATEGFGLMFYNARWYDPQLGRFAQADTIIPEQTQGTQAWDRYAYVNNNPLRYTDPSGHSTCTDDGYCGSSNATSYWNKVIKDLSSSYGITFSGKWSQKDKLAALTGAIVVAGALSKYTGVESISSFKAVFGELTFARSDLDPGYWGEYGQGTITYYAGASQWTTLVAHELGHAFNARIANNGGTTPYNTLAIAGIWTADGEQFAGNMTGYTVGGTGATCGNSGAQQCFDQSGNPIPANHYYRNPLAGHSFRHGFGDVSGEDFADMFANWATGGFLNNRYGNARSDFMTTNMAGWVNSATGGQ
ncbi:MAG: hypothetical protein L6461_02280 [Anaerolineae bacterium]|nr:hypothetical protein [Anaerolineae bacterium]